MHVLSFIALSGLTFLTTTSAATLKRQSSLQVMTPPTPWTYQGCFTDSVSSRSLPLGGYSADDMNEGACIEYCDQHGYSFAGVEYSRECYCAYSLASSSSQAADSDCTMACAGDSTQPCGAGDRLTVFSNGNGAPTENQGENGYISLGCWSDSQTARTLSVYEPSGDGIAFVYACTNTCKNAGYSYAGVEYGQECYCGNKIENGATEIDQSKCYMPCTGHKSETCGGPNAMNLYQAQ